MQTSFVPSMVPPLIGTTTTFTFPVSWHPFKSVPFTVYVLVVLIWPVIGAPVVELKYAVFAPVQA